jgi:hypothetical protein
MTFKLPPECLLLEVVFRAFNIKYLPQNAKDLRAIAIIFKHNLRSLEQTTKQDLIQICNILKQTHKDAPEVLDTESMYLYIETCFNRELKIYQTVNKISGIFKRSIRLGFELIDYWSNIDYLQLTPDDLLFLSKQKDILYAKLETLIKSKETLIYENKSENEVENYRQINLSKFNTYKESCLYIELSNQNLVQFCFENKDINIAVLLINHRKYWYRDNKFFLPKRSFSQERLMYCINNIKRQELTIKKLQELIRDKELITKAKELFQDNKSENQEIKLQRLNLELLFRGVNNDNIKEVSDRNNRKLERLNKVREKVLDIQLKYNISGLYKITEGTKELYDIYDDLSLTKKDKTILINQKPNLVKYWLESLHSLGDIKIFYKTGKDYEPFRISYIELLQMLNACIWVMPYTTSAELGLYLMNQSALTEDNPLVFIYL